MKTLNIAYGRVSTHSQSSARQREQLSAGGHDYYEDIGVSGTMPFKQRPIGSQLYRLIEQGRVVELYVLAIDRVTRNLSDAVELVDLCVATNTNLRIHNINLSLFNGSERNPIFTLLFTVMSSIAQSERDAIKERTVYGIQRAKLEGKYRGRKIGSTVSRNDMLKKEKYKPVVRLLNDGYDVSFVSKSTGFSRNTIYKLRACME